MGSKEAAEEKMVGRLCHKLALLRDLLLDWSATLFVLGVRKKVAIIKLDAIGDFLLWLHSAKALSDHYGKENVTLIVSSRNLELARLFHFWSDVYALDVSSFVKDRTYRSRAIREIRTRNFQTAIHCCYSRIFDIGDAVVRATNAPVRIGVDGDLSNISAFKKKITNKWYTRLIAAQENVMHESCRHEEFLKGLGLSDYVAGVYDGSKGVFDSKAMVMGGEDFSAGYFVVFPGASWEGRQWERHKFVEIISRLIESTGLRCILCGGPGEIEISSEIFRSCDDRGNILDMTGKVSLESMLGLIRDAEFIVGNETSCIHASALVRTHAICILGGGHFGRFVPYPGEDMVQLVHAVTSDDVSCFGCNWQCTRGLRSDHPVACIRDVSVDKVFNVCQRVWEVINRGKNL